MDAGESKAKARIARTEAYANSVRRMFNATVNEILALQKTLPKTEDGIMYSFDGETEKVRKKVEGLLRKLHSSSYAAITKGIKAEWEIANKECDDLIRQTFGSGLLKSDMFRSWTSHNTAAMNAFINRSDGGMNLSDRVWNSCRQLRDEMEIALTVGIGAGNSADVMSRTVRQCLNDPDLMFRRFRYKKGEDADGNPIWGRKWKKKVMDPLTGKTRFIDYDRDSYIPKGAGGSSRGVYKSAYKNAMRVARTETNMAYRRSDYERWNKMDFVRGIHIELSNQHPVTDICDAMQGDYPKNFYFSGWHPHCFCYATPILAAPEEMEKVAEEFIQGRKYTPRGEQIKDTPQSFKDWVTSNSERIRNAASKPYWVKDNPRYVDGDNGLPVTMDEEEIRRKTIQEIADQRHANRDDDAIRKAWRERQERYERIQQVADSVMMYSDSYEEVDASLLLKLSERRQYGKMWEESKNVARQIAEVKKRIRALKDIFPDAENLYFQYGLADLEQAHSVLKKQYEYLKTLKLDKQEAVLLNNLAYYKDNELLVDSFTKRLEQVRYDLKMERLAPEISTAVSLSGKSSLAPYKDKAAEADRWLKAGDLDKAEMALKEAKEIAVLSDRYDELLRYYKTTPAGMGHSKTDSKVGKDLKDAEKLIAAGKISEAEEKIKHGEEVRRINEESIARRAEKRKREKEAEEKRKAEEAARLKAAEEAAKKAAEEAAKKKSLANAKSYDDVKAYYGKDLPKTLVEYERAQREFTNISPSLKAQQKDVEKWMRELIENSDYGMAIRHDLLDSVLQRGFLNTFQTGTSQGYNGSSKTTGQIEQGHSRLVAAHKMFNPSNKKHLHNIHSYNKSYTGPQWEREEYEKYGHLLSRDKEYALSKQEVWYGDVQVRFRKDMVCPTITYDDSLCMKYQPSLACDPKIGLFDEAISKALTKNDFQDIIKLRGVSGSSYLELQYHGNLGVECAESLTFKSHPVKNGLVQENTLKGFAAKGVRIYYKEKGKIKELVYETPEERRIRILAAAKKRHEARDAKLAKAGTTATEKMEAMLEKRRKDMLSMKSDVEMYLSRELEIANADISLKSVRDKLKKGNVLGAKLEMDDLKLKQAQFAAEEKAMQDLIPDVHELHKTFTMKDLKGAHRAIKSKLDWIDGYYTADRFPDEMERLRRMHKKLSDEIQKFVDPATRPAFSTWEISKNAYERRLSEVSYKLKAQPTKDALDAIKAYKTTSAKIKGFVKDAEEMFAKGDYDGAMAKIKEAEKAKAVNEASKAAKAAKGKSAKVLDVGESEGVKFESDAYTAERRAGAVWAKNEANPQVAFNEVDKLMSTYAEDLWKRLSKDEKMLLYEYTAGSRWINEPLSGKIYSGMKTGVDGRMLGRFSERDINRLTSIIEKAKPLQHDMWVQHSEDLSAMASRFGISPWDDLTKLVGREAVNNPFMSTSCAKYSYFSQIGQRVKGTPLKEPEIVMSIYLPKGTKGVYCEPFAHYGDGKTPYGSERSRYQEEGMKWDGKSRQEQGFNAGDQVEFLLQRGSKIRVTKAEYHDGKWWVEAELVEQVPLSKFRM